MKIVRGACLGAWLAIAVTTSSLATQQWGGNPQPVNEQEVSWALFEPECRQQNAQLEVPCGDYGVFQFVSVDPADQCDAVTGGDEVPPTYGEPATPGDITVTPVDPDQVLYESLWQSVPTGASSGDRLPSIASGAALQPGDEQGAYAFGLSTGAPLAPPGPAPYDPAEPLEWLGVIDYSGTHGISTSWLADKISGRAIETFLGILDDPAFEPLGPAVGDFHVLAKLCQLTDFVDNGGDPPRVMNMSFGRSAREVDRDDPDNVVDGQQGCDESVASCQIAMVISHLTERGVTFVAAAGNHQELLFPAILKNVVSAGMLDLNRFLDDKIVEGEWETPPNVDALTMGSHLCLRHWAAPSGASYASAVLAGWLYEVLRVHPEIQRHGDGILWAPSWSDDDRCYRLSDGQNLYGPCNPYIQTLFAGLLGGNEESCWSVASLPAFELDEPGDPHGPPALPSLDEWSEETLPTPESDPCLPCVGLVSGNDLVIDFSSSVGLPTGIYLDAVTLRVGGDYYPLSLMPGELQAIEEGTLSVLQLSGWGWLAGLGEKMSLVYHQKVESGGLCLLPGSCYWTSTNVFMK